MFDIQTENGIAIIWLDQAGERVNTLSTKSLKDFADVLSNLESDDTVRAAVLISRKQDSFIVGADIKEFAQFQTKDQVINLISEGQELFNRLDNYKKPIVAAIHGACVGGGLELVMACDYRLATEHKRTLFALPEVNLGLLPGLGGTQRLPRLVGLQQALDMMLTGKNIYAKPAKKIGLVDAAIHPAGLLEAAKRAAQGLVDGTIKHTQRKARLTEALLEKTPLNALIYNKAAETVQQKTRGNFPAPPKIIETVRTGMTQGFKAGLEAEKRNFADLVFTAQSKALRHLFFAKHAAEKNPYPSLAKPVKRLGVIGAGLMGSGIAQVSSQAGYNVVLKDQTLELAAKGKANIYQEVTKRVGKGLSAFERDEVIGRVTPVTDYSLFKHVTLTLEAVLETLETKQAVLREVEAVVPEGHVFATNTSSIPIHQIAQAAQHPEAVLGMHYFSPVPKMPLLEIIKTDQSADWALATAMDVGLKQGKTPIVVGDAPGFYVNRILFPYIDEALKLLQEGATVDAVDEAMTAFGFPVGPLKLLDEVGIDVGAHVTDVIAPLFAKRDIQMVALSDEILKAGLKGRKSGKGFYTYDDGKTQGVNAEIYKYFSSERKTVPKSEIQERLFLAMLNEAVYCLQEGVIASARDGDVGAVFGIGFPPFLGGPFFYMDQQGAVHVLERLNKLKGAKFKASVLLEEYATAGRRFYE